MRVSEAVLMDNMEYMAKFPDKFFDLAVVDPPYNIKVNMNAGRKKTTRSKKRTVKKWDNESPKKEYWNELFRVSKNQIVFGGNYFTEQLPIKMGWIFWDKLVDPECSFSDGELIWTSFHKKLKKVLIPYSGFIGMEGEKFHPTTKPIKIYDWIYKNYLPEGGKVIDTHLGSGSNRIAADKAGNIDFYSCELDDEYFEAQELRFKQYKSQLKLFL